MSFKENYSVAEFTNYQNSLTQCLDGISAGKVLKSRKLIIIKPNLVNTSLFPITTSTEMIRALVGYLQNHTKARLIIAEGCGDAHLDTGEVYQKLGYGKLAAEFGLELVDLNNEPLSRLRNPDCRALPDIYLPKIALKGFLISVPVLKKHSLAGVTLSMKNMLGLAPPKHYQQGGCWKKSFFHSRMHRSIFELNLYRKPDLSILDATVGMADYHLGGSTCAPPVNKIVAGYDPVAVDSYGAGLLGLSWKEIPHIRMAHGVLGRAEG